MNVSDLHKSTKVAFSNTFLIATPAFHPLPRGKNRSLINLDTRCYLHVNKLAKILIFLIYIFWHFRKSFFHFFLSFKVSYCIGLH